ncbi:MAG: helix-turn-helix domain-containing protein, partial [Proteobacteria bacterium]
MSDNADLHQASPELATDIVGVGDMLRTTRESRGLTLVDVAQALKLTQRQVEALESERFDALPGAAFARGFLRNYARLLGLDPEPLIDALAQTSGVGAPELAPISNAQGTLPAGDGALRPSAFPIALIALLLLVAVVGGWYFDWFQQSDAPGPDSAVVDTPLAPAALTPVIPPADTAPLVIPDDAPSGSATDPAQPGSSSAVPVVPAAAPAAGGTQPVPPPAAGLPVP